MRRATITYVDIFCGRRGRQYDLRRENMPPNPGILIRIGQKWPTDSFPLFRQREKVTSKAKLLQDLKSIFHSLTNISTKGKRVQQIRIVKYALDSNLILSPGYGSTTRPKTRVPKVLDPHLSSYAIHSQKSDGVLRISTKITIASLKKTRLRYHLVECERRLEKFFCNFSRV